MRPLIDLAAFSLVCDDLNAAADLLRVSNRSTTLIAPCTLSGTIALAHIEAALIDSALPYNRRFLPRTPNVEVPSIRIGDGDATSAAQPLRNEPSQLQISPLTVRALEGHRGDPRTGRLSPVAIAAAFAECLNSSGPRVRRLRPWSLAGNWLHPALDQTYDPVYTSLRDHLREEGSIRVVPLPEVPNPEPDTIPGIDKYGLEALRLRWPALDLEGRARAISHLIRPALQATLPSTARLEELGWHRLLAADWSSDIASQLHDAKVAWDEAGGSLDHANRIVDQLVRDGRLDG